uniref:E3 SUMO-protein ligase ZBED1-like n=1 Tax=Solea senegalensis TaxID=28829 RepID=UPI001CD89919|nr:E3 SUMO-protein ligase ZBED1-like [Solea senegalensis]
MEPTRKRSRSQMWEHFELISPNKVQFLHCSMQLVYNNNTSSMLRHYSAKHENKQENTVHVDRKQDLDDPGFKEFVGKLDPTYTLPSRQALKKMVGEKYEEEKAKAKAQLQSVEAVSLTSDMWTSTNMDAYLAVTCHCVLTF